MDPKTSERFALEALLSEEAQKRGGPSRVALPREAVEKLVREAEEKDLSPEDVRKRLGELLRAVEAKELQS